METCAIQVDFIIIIIIISVCRHILTHLRYGLKCDMLLNFGLHPQKLKHIWGGLSHYKMKMKISCLQGPKSHVP
jgi:hypothetical protein